MKSHFRFIRPGLGGMVAFCLLVTGPLSPLAQAKNEETKSNYWESRKNRSHQRPNPSQANAKAIPPTPLGPPHPHQETSKNWFKVNSYTPVFGPKSWKRGNALFPFVTIIQDAHDNYEAQLALSRTLAELADKEKDGPLLVCVEGAWGPVNVSIVKNKISSGKIESTANDLLKRGLITGEEHRAMMDDRIHIMGVENQKMHRVNTLWQKTVINNTPLVNPWLQEITEWRKDLVKSLPPPIQDLILARDSYDKGESELNLFLKTLVQHWGKPPIPMEFSSIKTFLEIAREEEVDKEIKPMIHILLEEMGKDGMPATPMISLQNNTPRGLLNWWESVDQTKLSVKGRESYEKVRTRLKIRESAETMEPGKLQREIKAFYSTLLEKSLANLPSKDEHDLQLEKIKLARWISLRVHLAKLELTPELLTELLTEPMVYPWTWAAQKAETLNLRDHFPPPPREWRKTELAAIKFYRLASLRNGPMAAGTIAAARNANTNKVILVAGGFHARGLQAEFRQEGVMHQTFCPKFDIKSPQFELRKASNFMPKEAPSLINNPSGNNALEKRTKHVAVQWIKKHISRIKFNRNLFFWGVALFLLATLLFATPLDVGNVMQGEFSSQSIINSGKALLPSAVSLLLGYIRIPKGIFDRIGEREPSKEELIDRSKKKIIGFLENPETYDQALDVLISLHSSDPEDEIAVAIFDQLNDHQKKTYMNQAVEDPRWAMELAHVVQGKSRRERDTISREAIRLFPEALRDLEDINRIFEEISSENFNGKTPESIQSNFKELLQRHKNRLKSPNLNVLKDDGILVSPMDEDSQHISQAWTVFRYYKTLSEENARNYPSGEITPSASDPTKFLSQVRLMRGFLYTEIEFHESVAAMRQSGMAFPSTTGLGLEKGIGFGLLKKWARFYSGDSLTVGNKTTKLINNIQSAWKALSQSGQLVSGGVIELNRSIDIDTFPVSSTLKQPEFAEVMANAKTRLKDGTAPVIVALPWAQTKADFLLSIEKTSQTPSEVETLGGQQVVRFHAGPLFSDPTTAEKKMVQLLANIGREKPTVLVVDLDELVSDLFLLAPHDVASKHLQENFIHRMLDEWGSLPNKPTLLFLTSEDNHSFYLPETVNQQALRVEPTRESVHLSLLETLEGIREAHPSLTIENRIDTYILNQIYGESSLTLPDAQRMLAWVAAQKASQGQPMRVDDVRAEIARLPVIDKLPIARRVRAVAGKVTPEIREKIYKLANELRRARASKDEKEASRKEQYLDTVLGLFFFWKNTASKPPEERKTVDPNFRAQAKARFKQKYSGLDHIFDQLFDLCVLPKLGTEHSANAPPSDIPLLYGSPGVGKTSLGHAIAEMFGNDEHGDPFYKFAEISLAGESDGSKITGFSSTYAKSSTGAPLQLFRQAGTGKVVLLIDELDKGNSALFESLTRLLDQTTPFLDSYLSSEFPINTKDVQIVLTANSLEFLNKYEQLRDRVKIIHVPDYQPATLEQIATRHLLPQVMAEESLDDYISVPDPAAFVNKLLTDYPSIRSPRSIKKTIEFVLREAFNRQVGPGKTDPFATKIKITPDDIQIYLGPPQPRPQTGILRRDPGEVAMLAADFDDIFWVRAKREPGPPPKELVNHTSGNVEGEMEISGAIAVRIANKRNQANFNWSLNTSHPDIEKSGNSAGLAMGLAVVSEQEGVSVRPGFAVTGALKTNGEVAEVAGLDGKIPSGLHHGIHSFLLPRQNMDELLNIMVYNPSLSGIVLRKENDVLTETLVFPQDVPELIPGDPIMATKDWESLFTETDSVQIVPSKFAGINGWQVEGTPEAIAKWLSNKPALVPLTNAPTYFLCSTIDEAIEFSLETQSTASETKEDYLTRLDVKHVDKRTLPERAPQTREKSTEPAEKAKTTLEIIPLQSPPVSLTPPGRGRDPLKLIGITPNIVSEGIAYRENYFATLTRIIEKTAEHNALEGLRATIALSIACQDLFTSIKRKESVRGISLAGIDYDQIERGLRKIDSFKNQAKDIITKSSDSEETIKSKIRSFLDGVDGIGYLINELTKFSPDPSQPNNYRRLLIEHWVERYFFGRENISKSDLGLSMLALRGALDIQNDIDINVLQERTPPKRDLGTSPLDPIDKAAGRVTPYLNVSHGGILTFTVEEEAKPFLLDSLAAAAQSPSGETHPITFLEINFSAPSLSPTDTNSVTQLLNIVHQARAAGGTGLVVDLDRLFDTYGNRTAGVLNKMVQLAQGLQPGTNSVQSFLPLPLIFVGKEESYYRASDICPAFDGLALVTTVEAELAVLIRRTANSLCANQRLSFSPEALEFAIGRVKHTGYDTALQAMKSALGQTIGDGETRVSDHRLKGSFEATEAKIGRSNTGYSLIWIKERIQLIQDESIKRLVKTYYSQLLATPQTDSNYVTLYSYLEAVARFPWEQVNAPLADPEDYETLLKRMAYAEERFNETHFGMTEVQRIIRHTLQSNWRRLNHGLPPRGLQYTLWGSPGTGKTSAVPAMARAITYNGPQGLMTTYGSWDIDMAGMDDPSNLLGFLRTYVGARWGALYGGLIERGLYSIFGIDEPSRARTSQKGNPTDALTRFLDPAFRDKFTDTFIAFAVPLGPLMVVLLTNDKLPDHIEDRTTLVVIPDPTPEQLAQIGQRHTLTRVHKKFGIKSHLLTIDDSAMQEIVTNYVPHGARDLQRVISLLGAAAANESLSKGESAQPIHVTRDNLKSFLGSPPRSTSRNLSKKEPLPGEVLTFIDGMPSMVHAVHFPREDTDGLYPTISPLLDPPMKESAHLAFKNAVVNNPSDKKGEIFIDPSGPKEFKGASSGLAYYMAVQSAISEQPIPKGVAYLGGIDATGRISKVSPKLLSESASNASKFGLTKLVLPGENIGDLEALFFNQPRLASRTRYQGKDTLRVPFKNAGPRPDWAAPEVIAMWEAESRQAAAWNEYLRSQDLYNQASSMNLTLKVNNDKGIQISGSQESLDSLLEEHVEFTPPLTFELIDNVNALSPPSTPRQKPLEKIAASWIGAIATALILGNLINLAATFSVQAATVTAAASSAAWAVPLGASLIILFMFTMRQNIIKNTPLPALLSDLIRIGFASPNPTFDKLVSEYAKSGKLTPATRLGIFGLLAPPLDPNLDPVILNEVNSAYARAREGMMEGHNFILPDRSSFLDLVGVGVGTDGAPPPVITFDWDSLKQGKTTTLLDGIAQAKPVGSILAFVATGKGQTTAEMANYVETRWPGLDKSYRVVYVDSDQISKNNLGEVNKVHSEKLANYISRQILNGSQISLRVLVSSEHRNRWVGLALDIIPIDAGYSVQGLLGAFRNTHLIFNIQA